MTDYYLWVPWFRELTKKISQGGPSYLIEKSKKVNWADNKNDPPLLRHGHRGIDPFSFLYFLAFKNTSNKFELVYQSVHDEFEISVDRPKNEIYFPTPTRLALFHNKKTFKPELLWKLFQQSLNDIPEIDQKVFKDVLNIKGVGVSNLTQSLFIVNPQHFFPIDDDVGLISKYLLDLELSKLKKSIEVDGYDKYATTIEQIKIFFPGCCPCEINLFLYLQKKEKLVNNESEFFQVSSNVYNKDVDWWELNNGNQNGRHTFNENSCVFTGGPGNNPLYPLTHPNRGDIILVRYGRRAGRGIGIVDSNEYQENGEFNINSVIRVFWINKSSSDLASGHFTPIKGFSAAGESTISAFQEADGYRRSFDLINSLTGENNNNGLGSHEDGNVSHHPLNLILYGPSGTGKTYATAQYCVEICDGLEKRSKKEIHDRYKVLVKESRIEFVTFHQSYGYEEFVVGLRPETKPDNSGEENVAGFRLVRTDGVLKRIADRARKKTLPYVLVIDEINRANISKVLGELVTLLEEDKRKDAKHEKVVTLPYSEKDEQGFTVPANLYILGTMNTADRSIAHLDTALRRRFDFVELPPKPDELKKAAESTGINLPEVLRTMNNRIEWLLDRDRLIGHAWLMEARKKEDVDRIMRRKIIPLIVEYFYEDWRKVRSVLGGGNDFVSREQLPLPPEFDDEDENRYSWTIKDEFKKDAYDCLISGQAETTESRSE